RTNACSMGNVRSVKQHLAGWYVDAHNKKRRADFASKRTCAASRHPHRWSEQLNERVRGSDASCGRTRCRILTAAVISNAAVKRMGPAQQHKSEPAPCIKELDQISLT